ncbi:class I SAM-dependent methyltransferase [Mucilaginibacter mali]|uniref:Class I SAM-dependent methyltransferase n=1 Tax=Mucilaginibacter mali TaxID=2740462 RepID=A0A7D4TZP4_9SPHI|nr:class I SAM-dependent methyltransferase [Mucilaginibacter mali]QKJ32397.1 class I SAM-dependent methyltransferase [Mucilaginibacter mali]
MNPTSSPGKVNYGIDAPGVVRNLVILGTILIITVIIFPHVKVGSTDIDTRGFIWSGASCVLAGLLMLLYSLNGKYHHRDRMLSLISWKGNEQVLDVGTGLGLLMIGAAKQLNTGRSTGIDTWSNTDLSRNKRENTIKNAVLEQVGNKCAIMSEDATEMSFADETFDVILSNLCIHNIYEKPRRLQACQEIARVLKKGGTAVISDFRHMHEYRYNFKQLGLDTEMMGANYLMTFPPLNILVVKKQPL